jgi:DNA-binding NtrC family response regulator
VTSPSRDGGDERQDDAEPLDTFEDESATTVLVAAPGAPVAKVRSFQLRVLTGPDQGKVVACAAVRTVVGTHHSCDLALSDRTISHFHCAIVLGRSRPLVQDLDSRNGTEVNGVPVMQAYLRHGATLRIGHTELRFELRDDQLEVPLAPGNQFGLLVGGSTVMRSIFAVLARAAQSDAAMLLEGETGTGKDAAAESIHQASSRHDKPFVIVDCGAIPAELLESELFGHERGAFTGATTSRMGAFEAARGGTLFLDEVGELRLDLQPKLLRALERREVRRVGGTRVIRCDLRVIAATNRDLRAEVNSGRFRADLFFRLAVLTVRLPPLRERLEDLPLLIEHLLRYHDLGDEPARARLLEPELLLQLRQQPWRGNVRELRNFLERALALGDEVVTPPADESADELGYRAARASWTRSYLERLMHIANQNVAAAARLARVDRVHLYRLLRQHGLYGPAGGA